MRYLTINYTVTFPNPNAKPIHYSHSLLQTPDGEMFYHPEGGPTHFYLKEYGVVKDHGELNLGDNWDTIEQLILSNAKTHHCPEQVVRPGAGWLSLQGKFYPCKAWEHDGLARQICRAVLGVLEGTGYLESRGWIRIYEDGLVALRQKLNQKQLNTVWDLHQASDDEEYKEQINRAIGRK